MAIAAQQPHATARSMLTPSFHLWWRFFWRCLPISAAIFGLSMVTQQPPYLRPAGMLTALILLVAFQIWLLSGFIFRKPFSYHGVQSKFQIIAKTTSTTKNGWGTGLSLWWGIIWRTWLLDMFGILLFGHAIAPDTILFLADQSLAFWWMLAYPMGRYRVTVTAVPTARTD